MNQWRPVLYVDSVTKSVSHYTRAIKPPKVAHDGRRLNDKQEFSWSINGPRVILWLLSGIGGGYAE